MSDIKESEMKAGHDVIRKRLLELGYFYSSAVSDDEIRRLVWDVITAVDAARKAHP